MNKLTTLTGLTVALVLSGQSVLAMENGKGTMPRNTDILAIEVDEQTGQQICALYDSKTGTKIYPDERGILLGKLFAAASMEKTTDVKKSNPSKVVFRCESYNAECQQLLQQLSEMAAAAAKAEEKRETELHAVR